MAYDEALADRIRGVLGERAHLSEKKMFGGIAFLEGGKMFCGVAKNELMVRVGPKRYEASLAKAHVRPMDFTGRPMKGYVFVEPPGCRTDREVSTWVELALAFVVTLSAPSKAPKRPARRLGR